MAPSDSPCDSASEPPRAFSRATNRSAARGERPRGNHGKGGRKPWKSPLEEHSWRSKICLPLSGGTLVSGLGGEKNDRNSAYFCCIKSDTAAIQRYSDKNTPIHIISDVSPPGSEYKTTYTVHLAVERRHRRPPLRSGRVFGELTQGVCKK